MTTLQAGWGTQGGSTSHVPQGLQDLITRTRRNFDPNHELGEQSPIAPLELVELYTTDSRIVAQDDYYLRGHVYQRALFWLVLGILDEAPEDGGPWCLMVPFRAWESNSDGYWRLSDRTAQRVRNLLWSDFGFVTY